LGEWSPKESGTPGGESGRTMTNGFPIYPDVRPFGLRVRIVGDIIEVIPVDATESVPRSRMPSGSTIDEAVRGVTESARGGRAITWDEFVRNGQRVLGRILFPPEVEAAIAAVLDRPDNAVIRIEIEDLDERSRSLPWEYARVGRNRPFAIDPRTTIVRRHGNRPRAERRPADEIARRAVVVISDAPCAGGTHPRCRPNATHWPPLSAIEEHGRAIAGSLEQLLGQQVEVVSADVASIRAACEEPVDVFVYLGHGDRSPVEDGRATAEAPRAYEASLVLAGPSGPETLGAKELGELLRGAQLVALCCCHGASEHGRQVQDGLWLGGFRSALEVQGVPAVVGMNGPVDEVQSGEFFRVLFDHLAAGATLDQAVSLGRLELCLQAELPIWGHPVLSLGPQEPRLPRRQARRAVTSAVRLDEDQIAGMPWVAKQRLHRVPALNADTKVDSVLAITTAGLTVLPGEAVEHLRAPVVLSADGAVAAAIEGGALKAWTLDRYELGAVGPRGAGAPRRRWRFAWPALVELPGPSPRVLAVTLLGHDGVAVVLAGESTEWIRLGRDGSVDRRALASAAATVAVFVRGEPWWVEDGRLCAQSVLEWSPENVLDLDVAGPVGGEVAAVVVGTGGVEACELIGDPVGDPSRLHPPIVVAPGTRVVLQRFAPRVSRKVVAHLSDRPAPEVWAWPDLLHAHEVPA
jgi:hypothetical protein